MPYIHKILREHAQGHILWLIYCRKNKRIMVSEPPGSFRNRIYCLFYASSYQTLSIYGQPLGGKGHAEHLIHSSRLIVWETNTTPASGGYGLVQIGCWWRDYTLSIMQRTETSIQTIFKTSIRQVYHFPCQPEDAGRPQMHSVQARALPG